MSRNFDLEFESRKDIILNSESINTHSKNTYYVSSKYGSDDNDGLTEKTPWKTLEKVSKASLCFGDKVVFRRNDVFRGQVYTKPGVIYSAYGTGKKPEFYGSETSLCNSTLWELYDEKNFIWKCTEPMLDAGTIVFNSGEYFARKLIPSYNGEIFVLRDNTDIPFIISEQLTNDLDFYWEFGGNVYNTTETKGENFPVPEMYEANSTGTIYLRCEKGNPAEIFKTIESVARRHMFIVGDNENVTIDNICVKYVGMHGVTGGGHVKGLTVTNCEFGFIGGSIQHFLGTDPNFPDGGRGSVTRFGNAIEIYGGCEDFTVENNYIYQSYDAGITHQITTDRKVVMKNITYKNNLIEKCVYGIEYFLNKIDGENESIMENVEISGNFIRLSGCGWGQQRHNTDTPAHIKIWNFSNTAKSFTIRNNIFDRSAYRMLHLVCDDEMSLPTLSNNTYIQSKDGILGQYGVACGNGLDIEMFNEDAYKIITKKFGDKSAEIYFV